MQHPNVSISRIGPESDPLLRNLLVLYVQDMAQWFELEPDAVYDTSPVWANGYAVYLAKLGNSIAGFAIVVPGTEWDVHEFFVLRECRRGGVGQNIATLVWNAHRGQWLVRVLEANAPGVSFWRAAISRYSLSSHSEERRTVKGRGWTFFRFDSKPIEEINR